MAVLDKLSQLKVLAICTRTTLLRKAKTAKLGQKNHGIGLKADEVSCLMGVGLHAPHKLPVWPDSLNSLYEVNNDDLDHVV